MYPEYTGTGFLVILNPDKETINKLLKNKSAVYSYVKSEFDKKYDLTWLKPIGFNNAYALMMRREQAAQLKIKKISDLTQLANDK